MFNVSGYSYTSMWIHMSSSFVFAPIYPIIDVKGPVGCFAKFSKKMLKAAYGGEMNIQFPGNTSVGHSCSQHANCMLPQNLCISCIKELHILQLPFIFYQHLDLTFLLLSLFLLFNKHPDMSHLPSGWTILAKGKCSIIQSR